MALTHHQDYVDTSERIGSRFEERMVELMGIEPTTF